MASIRKTTTRIIVPRGFSGSPINRITSSSPTARIGYKPMQTSFARESIKKSKGESFAAERREKRIQIASEKSALEALRAATANGETLTREQVKRIVLKNVPKDQRGKILNKVQAIDRNQKSGKFKLYGVTYDKGKEEKAEAVKFSSGAELNAKNTKLYKISPKLYRAYSAFQKKTRKYDPITSAYNIGYRAVEDFKTKRTKRIAVGSPIGLLPMPKTKNNTYYSKTTEPSQVYSFLVPRTSGELAIDYATSYGIGKTLQGLKYAKKLSPKILKKADRFISTFAKRFETKYVLSGVPIPKSQRRLSKVAIRKKNFGQFSMPKRGSQKLYTSVDNDGRQVLIKVRKVDKNFKVTEILSRGEKSEFRGIIPSNNNKALVAVKSSIRKPVIKVIEERTVNKSPYKAVLSYTRGQKGSGVLTIVKRNNQPIVFKNSRQVDRVVSTIANKDKTLQVLLKKNQKIISRPKPIIQIRPKIKPQFVNRGLVIEMDSSGKVLTFNGLKPQKFARLQKQVMREQRFKQVAGFRKGMREKLFSKLRQKQQEIYSKRELQLWKGRMPATKYGKEMSKELLKSPTLVIVDEGTDANKRFLVARNQKLLNNEIRGGKIINAKYRIIKIKSSQKLKQKSFSKYKTKSKIRAKQKTSITNKQIIRRALGSNIAIKQLSSQAQRRIQKSLQSQAQTTLQTQKLKLKLIQRQQIKYKTRKPTKIKIPKRTIKSSTNSRQPSRNRTRQPKRQIIKTPKKENQKIPAKRLQQKKMRRIIQKRRGKYYNERTYKYVKL